MTLVVMIGEPGSGKSTFVRDRFLPTQIVNLDTLRGIVSDNPGNQDATAEAVCLQNQILAARCRRRLLTVVDATNVRADVREGLLKHAGRHRLFTVAVVLDVPLQTCLDRNAERIGAARVPDDVIRRMRQQRLDDIGEHPGLVPGFASTFWVGGNLGVYTFGRIPTGDLAWLR